MLRGLIAAAMLGASAHVALAQNVRCAPGDLEVARLTFEGNHAFSSTVLGDGIVTTPSTWARRTLRIFGAKRCLDRTQFPLDVLRLLVWYRNHGYTAATVDTVLTPMGQSQVGIRFSIREGSPMLVDSLSIVGLEGVPERERVARGLATEIGEPFDKYANEATRDSLTRRLRNGGYPDAEVFVGYDTRLAERRARVVFTVVPGARVYLGEIGVQATPRSGTARAVTDEAIRTVAGVRRGDLYSEEELERAKRALYQTELFTQVSLLPDSSVSVRDSTVRVSIDVTEGLMRSARIGGGYGTLDCFRATGDLTQYNFSGGATRLDLRARLSKIGVGRPLNGLARLCPQASDDPYSKDLNYSLGATISQSPVFHEFVPSYSVFSERRSEYNAFLRTIPVGGSVSLSRRLARITQAVSYSAEYGKTEAQPALLCAVFNACTEADRESFVRLQRLGVLSASVSRETSDNPLNPAQGSVVRIEVRTAGSFTGSDAKLRFSKILTDGAMYKALGPDIVLAARVRFGAVVGSGFSFSNNSVYVPPQERLFAGGPTTVRGFRQNELGPALYIPGAYDTVRASGARGGSPANPRDTVYFRARADSSSPRVIPTGGNALIVANLEARVRSPILPDLVQGTLFADVGEVWNRGAAGAGLGFSSLRWSPGLGVRVKTLIGFLRLDIAYNPYQRPSGSAYFDTSVASGGALLCVSPGNTLRVTSSGGQLQQETGSCPATFQPPRESSFLRRLTPSISIGQAF